MKKLFSFLFVYFLINPATFSQDDKSLLTDLLKEDQQTIEALVLYPDSIRRIILEAAGQPDALARMENLHEKTQEKFKDIISPFSQEVQANFYELARHPRLIHALVLNGKKTKTEIKSQILRNLRHWDSKRKT